MELKIMLLALCVGSVQCASYKAAIVDRSMEFNEDKVVSTIHEASQLNVDILMLPKLESSNYDKLRQAISDATKKATIYVTAQIVDNTLDKTRNFVFDRNGSAITLISKPSFYRDTLLADFGVTFSLVEEEDLVTSVEGVRNAIAFAPVPASQHLNGLQSSGAWAYTTRSNLITARAIYGGPSQKIGGLVVVELNSDHPEIFEASHHLSDLSDLGYTAEPLRGSGAQRVCHGAFCCDFDVTTKSGAALPYSLLSYSGLLDGSVRLETCALVACVGQHHSCFEELERNKTNVFEKVTVSAYFNTDSKQYPIFIAPDSTFDDTNFSQRNQSNHASIELLKKKVTGLGIFGISKDLETQNVQANDDLSELFDYLWIRLRVAIFIVSIYVLEMM